MKVSPSHRIPIHVHHSCTPPQTQSIDVRLMQGKWQSLRVVLHRFILLFYFVLPWLLWNDKPVVLVDLEQSQFYGFGFILGAHDLLLLACLFVFAA